MARSILVVDDTVFARRLLRDILKLQGFAVSEATSGLDALAVYREVCPQLVILDDSLPDLSWPEVLRMLREEHAEARVLVVGAQPAEHVEAQIREAGAAGYLAKPFRPAQLLEGVRLALRASKQADSGV
jgi:DNA-binding response OmpR family regulator